MIMRVIELWRYPIKSIGGEQLTTAEVGKLGIAGDRGWGLVDDLTGNVLTARREPKLLMASTRLVEGEPLTTTAEGAELRTGADYAEWLDRPVTLARAGSEGGTYENPGDVENDADWMSWQGPSGAWHDSGRSRLSLVTTASLRHWDQRRFRANVILDGSGEDALVGTTVVLGTTRLEVVKQIARCVMVTRPQPGLERELAVFRSIQRELGGTLSVGATVDEPGTISVGDGVDPPA